MTETASTTSMTETTSPSGSSSESRTEPIGLQNEEERRAFYKEIGRTASGEILARRVKGKETKKDKAIRLLVSGRLRVYRVDRNLIEAECRGDSGELYTLGFWRMRPDAIARWHCTCPARTDCSHLMALWCVTAVTR